MADEQKSEVAPKPKEGVSIGEELEEKRKFMKKSGHKVKRAPTFWEFITGQTPKD